LELFELVVGCLGERKRDLMGMERTLDEFTMHDLGTGKTLWCTEDKHRPPGLDQRMTGSSGCLNCLDFRQSPFHGGGNIVIEVGNV